MSNHATRSNATRATTYTLKRNTRKRNTRHKRKRNTKNYTNTQNQHSRFHLLLYLLRRFLRILLRTQLCSFR